MRFSAGQSLEGQINVTPMIDVLLVLLVIFMLAIQLRMVFHVNVPAPAVEDRRPTAPQVVLDLRADGSYTLNQDPVGLADLQARLSSVFRDGKHRVLYIRAAAKRRYREVIEAVDVARAARVPIVGYMP